MVEQGSHNELVAQNGVYKKLVERQMISKQLGEEPEEIALKRKQSKTSLADDQPPL